MIYKTTVETIICLGIAMILTGCQGGARQNPASGIAEVISEKKAPRSFYLTGQIKGEHQADTVSLAFWKYLVRKDLGREDYISLAKDGSFSFEIEAPKHFGYLSLDIPGFKGLHNRGSLMDYYLMAPGDSIHVEISNGALHFSGPGSGKYKARAAMDSAVAALKRPPVLNTVLPENLELSMGWQDSVFRVQEKLLRGYKESLPNESYILLHAEILGKKEYDKYFYYWLSRKLARSDAAMLDQLTTLYSEIIVKSKVQVESWLALPYSRRFTDYLILKSRIDDQQGIIDFSNENVALKSEYLSLKKNYTGLLQEKLLTCYLANKYTLATDQQDLEYCFVDYFKVTTTPYFREILTPIYESQRKGALAYDFSLPDSKGDTISLSDFRGKLVFLDFWFTGCTGCLMFAKTLDEVHSSLKEDQEVVFISISIDKDRKKWNKSVESGRYSPEGSVNLYTEGKGHEHPLIEHYNVKEYPHPMIIDREGSIYKSSGLRLPAKELVDIIETALERERPGALLSTEGSTRR